MTHRRSLDAVDAALEEARQGARDSTLPRPLRARILAAAAPAPPRGRVLDFVLRAAAVAAAAAVVFVVAPVRLDAAEFDPSPLVEWNARLAASVARGLPALDAPREAVATIGAVPAWQLAAAAVALAGAGAWLVRREGRR
jgi:hypothetical protein